MNLANGQRSTPSPDARDDVRAAARSCAQGISIMTTNNLLPLAEILRLITATYFVADATERKHFDAIFQQLQSLTEYEHTKLASARKADSSRRKTGRTKRRSEEASSSGDGNRFGIRD